MENRSASRSATTGDETTTVRSGTTVPPKRPVTKPVAPRLSTSTSTRPSATSRTTSTTSQSSLNKPPTRPTTVSAARKPTASDSNIQSTTTHRSQPSATSVETSGDEARRDGITARPKRMSLAPSTSAAAAQRLSSTRTPTVTTTTRRTPATPTTTSRTIVTSPTSTTKRPLASTTRTSSTLSSRTRPLSSASSRTSTLTDRKRLSTIPASPAVKGTKKSVNELDAAESGIEQELSEAEFAANPDASDAEAAPIRNGSLDAAELDQLRSELEQSRTEVSSLQSQLQEAILKALDLETLAQKQTEEVQIVSQSNEESEAAHKKELENLQAELKTFKQDQLDAIEAKSQEIKQLTDELESSRAVYATVSTKDAIIRNLESELELLKQKPEPAPQKDEDTTSSSQTQELVDARQELAAIQSRHAMAKENAKSKIAKAAETHAKEKAELEESHKSQIESMQARSDNLETDLIAKLSELEKANNDRKETLEELQDLRRLQDEQNKERDNHIKELETRLVEAAGKVESQNRESSAADQKLTQELEAAVEALESTKKDHEQEIATLKSEHESRQADALRAAKVRHDNDIAEIASKLSKSHNAATQEMKELHADQLRQLEEQSKSALVDLEGLETSNAATLEKVKAEAEVDRAEALQRQDQEYQKAAEALKSKLASAEAALKSTKEAHVQELGNLRSEHESLTKSKIAELMFEHEKQVATLSSSSSKEQEAVIAQLKASHLEQSKKFDDQKKAVLDEAEAAKFQSVTMKTIIGDLEREIEQTKKDHEEEVGKLQEDFSQAIMKLSAQSEQMAQYEMRISESKALGDTEKEQAVESARQQHEQELQTLMKELAATNELALEKLRADHLEAIGAANGRIKLHESIITDLKAKHERALEEAIQSKDQEYERIIGEGEASHISDLEGLRSSLKSQHDTAMKGLQDEHDNKIADQMKQASNESDKLKSEHVQVVNKLRSELNDLHMKLEDTSELDALKAELNDRQNALKIAGREQQEKLASITAEHALELNKLKEDIQAEQASSASRIEAIQKQLAEALYQKTTLSQEHNKAVQEYEAALSSLQADVDQANAASTSASATTSSEVEQLKYRLRDAEKTISELTEQYTHAAFEAESQRQAADKADRELTDLKQSLLKATEEPIASPIAVDTAKVTTQQDTKEQSTFSPGLKASRWATNEPATNSITTSTPESPSTPAHAAASTNNGDPSAREQQQTPQSQSKSSSSRKKNRGSKVRGQMAGMNESIRQLDELNEEILDGHRRMAKVLSRGEGDDTVTVTNVMSGRAGGDRNGVE